MSKVLNIFNNLTTVQKSLTVSIVSIILFITSTSLAYSLFSQVKSSPGSTLVTSLPTIAPGGDEDPSQPKTEACPLNGQMFTKQTRDRWEKLWPIAVMIENHTEARPQSGLSTANIVYEAVAEGGITRFMALYLCNPSDVQIGPVRSARTYFLDWLSEYDALYAHVGGANCNKATGSGCANGAPADAIGQIIKYNIRDMNQMNYAYAFPTYWRDYTRLPNRATEHTMYSALDKLWKKGIEMWLNPDNLSYKDWQKGFVQWKFKDDPKSSLSQANSVSSAVNKINVNFWQGYNDYMVNWNYDLSCNCYKRSNGGADQIDLNNKQQLMAKNVVVQFERESNANDGYENNAHLLYKTIGEGKALIFQDGQVIEGKWIKKSRITRSKYIDASGKEIIFTRGPIWIQTVPEGAKVVY